MVTAGITALGAQARQVRKDEACSISNVKERRAGVDPATYTLGTIGIILEPGYVGHHNSKKSLVETMYS